MFYFFVSKKFNEFCRKMVKHSMKSKLLIVLLVTFSVSSAEDFFNARSKQAKKSVKISLCRSNSYKLP